MIQGNKKCQAAFVLSQKLRFPEGIVCSEFSLLVYVDCIAMCIVVSDIVGSVLKRGSCCDFITDRCQTSFTKLISAPFYGFPCFTGRRISNRSMDFRPGLIVLLCFLGFISAIPVKFMDCGKLHPSLFRGFAQVVGVDFKTYFDQSRFGAHFYFSKVSSVNLSGVSHNGQQGKPSCHILNSNI